MLKWFKASLVFVLVFSFFNGSFISDNFGENSLKIIFAVFTFLSLPSVAKNINIKTFRELKECFYFLAVLLLLWVINLVNAEFTISEWLNLITIGGIILIVLFFIGYDINYLLYTVWICIIFSICLAAVSEPVTNWTFRRTGGIGDPNEFSAHLLFFLFISVYLFRKNRSVLFLVISLVLTSYGLLIAASLSALLILPLLILILLIRYAVTGRATKYMLAGFCILISAFLIENYYEDLVKYELISNVMNRTTQLGTMQTRLDSWEGGINMFLKKPLTGVGMNQYHNYSNQYASNYLNTASIAPHNVYLKVLAESGIIVFIFFMYFILKIFYRHFKLYYYSTEFLLGMACLGFLLMGLTLGITYEKYFWLGISIIINLNYNYAKNSSGNIKP